jgi:hypothetical protein
LAIIYIAAEKQYVAMVNQIGVLRMSQETRVIDSVGVSLLMNVIVSCLTIMYDPICNADCLVVEEDQQ